MHVQAQQQKTWIAVLASATLSLAFSTITVGADSNQSNRAIGQLGRRIDTHAKVALKASEVNARFELSQERVLSGQTVGITVDFDIAPGWHIYGSPLPEGYVPATVTFDNELLSRQKLNFPKPTPVRFELLGETLPVYQGRFKAEGDIVLRENVPPGEHRLSGILSFQACNDSLCKMPQQVHFDIPLWIESPAAKPGLSKLHLERRSSFTGWTAPRAGPWHF
ncbi:MAG: hypothetical protein JO166_03100 [Deltaproteobacteria bacterium]|nr:hypothetical protein [Deltaproteobacteria bacterium]